MRSGQSSWREFAPREMFRDDGQATYVGGLLEEAQVGSGSASQGVLSTQIISSDVWMTSEDVPPVKQKGIRPPKTEIASAVVVPVTASAHDNELNPATDKVHFGPASTDNKPEPTYFVLLKHALLFSPQKKLTLGQIYEALEGRWPWFSYAGKGWKNTVRNVLSLGPSFQKALIPAVKATDVETGATTERGTYWSFDSSAPEGCPREDRSRKRHRKTGLNQGGPDESKPKTRTTRRKSGTFPAEELAGASSMTGIVDQASATADGDTLIINLDRSSTNARSMFAGYETPASSHASASSDSLVGPPFGDDLLHARSSGSHIGPLAMPGPNAGSSIHGGCPSQSSLSRRVVGSSSLSRQSSQADDPFSALSSSPVSSPVSTASPPMLSPSSRSTSLSSLDEWFGPSSGVTSSWSAGLEGSLMLATMDEDDGIQSTQADECSSAMDQLLYTPHPFDSSALISPSWQPALSEPGAHRELQSTLAPADDSRGSPLAPQTSARLGDNTDSHGSNSALGCAVETGKTAVYLSEIALDVPPAPSVDLSVLVGRSPEFWKGLWAGWNAASPGRMASPDGGRTSRAGQDNDEGRVGRGTG